MSATHDGAMQAASEAAPVTAPAAAPPRRLTFSSWLLADSPYIAMLLLALAGVILHLPTIYWVVLTPIFAIICIIAGWRGSKTRQALPQLIITQVLSWFAVTLAFYISTTSGMAGLMNVPATSLANLTQLALGTFLAGLQARVWRICAVGAVLFLAAPGIGWLKQSGAAIAAATLAIIAIGGVTWWIDQRFRRSA